MEEIQTLQDDGAVIEADREKLIHDTQNAEIGLRNFESQSKKERDQYQSQWNQHAEKIEPQALTAFNRVAQRHDGEALAAVEKTHPKRDEYMCSGCNMNISLEIVNSLYSRNDIQICGACGRILYLESASAAK